MKKIKNILRDLLFLHSNLIFRDPQNSTLQGFTLIEILVGFAVVAILSGVGLYTLSTYSKNQTTFQSASNLKETFAQIKYDALSGVKTSLSDNNCPKDSQNNPLYLQAYEITIDNSTTYSLHVFCGSDQFSVVGYSQSYVLPSGIIFQPGGCNSVRYDTISNAITYSPDASCQITISYTDGSNPQSFNP